mmetsp:Transcript_61742/g.194713  ORF Transcript_61742/g.194713 Transcript_61742/m.194713 type:complete len:230 (-) Transcript_61742:25-714(-)
MAIRPPMLWPMNTTLRPADCPSSRTPAFSSAARTSAASCAGPKSAAEPRGDKPWPRRSTATQPRPLRASSCIVACHVPDQLSKPWTRTTVADLGPGVEPASPPVRHASSTPLPATAPTATGASHRLRRGALARPRAREAVAAAAAAVVPHAEPLGRDHAAAGQTEVPARAALLGRSPAVTGLAAQQATAALPCPRKRKAAWRHDHAIDDAILEASGPGLGLGRAGAGLE